MKAFNVAAYIMNLCIEKGSPVSTVVINQNTYNISHADNVIFSINADDAKKISQNAEIIAKIEQSEQSKAYQKMS